jgi:hypothetical protein
VGSSLSSSSSSSSDDQCKFHELVHGAIEARQRLSDTTREVGRLECYLNTIEVALAASERETTAAQATTADSQAHIVGKGSLCLVVLSIIRSF